VVFGPEARTRVWLVQDGETLYVDRNVNGDLTEPGQKVSAEKRDEGADEGTFTFKIGEIHDGQRGHKELQLSIVKIDALAAWDESAREKLEAELKSIQAEKEKMAKALANSKAELAKAIADKSAAFVTLQTTINERLIESIELRTEIMRLQDAQVVQKKNQVVQKKKADKRERDLISQKELVIDSFMVLVLVFVLVLVAVPWEMWISASSQPGLEGNNREGSSTRWMRTRAFLKRRWRWAAVPAAVVIWAIAATLVSESRGASLYRRSQLLLPGMSREEVIKTMGSVPVETHQMPLEDAQIWAGIIAEVFQQPLEQGRNWTGSMSWEDDRWQIYVILQHGKFVNAFSRDNNPTMVTRSFDWLNHQLNWSVTDKLWRWSL
jgi:hypothetical protein